MNFKVGDFIEVVGNILDGRPSKFCGFEGCVIAVGCEFTDSLGRHRADGVRATFSSQGRYLPPERFRLKRPPSWDRWIYDTSGVTPEVELVSHGASVAWTDRA